MMEWASTFMVCWLGKRGQGAVVGACIENPGRISHRYRWGHVGWLGLAFGSAISGFCKIIVVHLGTHEVGRAHIRAPRSLELVQSTTMNPRLPISGQGTKQGISAGQYRCGSSQSVLRPGPVSSSCLPSMVDEAAYQGLGPRFFVFVCS